MPDWQMPKYLKVATVPVAADAVALFADQPSADIALLRIAVRQHRLQRDGRDRWLQKSGQDNADGETKDAQRNSAAQTDRWHKNPPGMYGIRIKLRLFSRIRGLV